MSVDVRPLGMSVGNADDVVGLFEAAVPAIAGSTWLDHGGGDVVEPEPCVCIVVLHGSVRILGEDVVVPERSLAWAEEGSLGRWRSDSVAATHVVTVWKPTGTDDLRMLKRVVDSLVD
jgi:hypothetical protein